MKIIKVSVKNYKSIEDSGILELNSKINIFAGKNNTGKTSFIESVYILANSQLYDAIQPQVNCFMEMEITKEDLKYLNHGAELGYIVNYFSKMEVTFSFYPGCVAINKVNVFDDEKEEYVDIWVNKSVNEQINYVYGGPYNKGSFGDGRRPQFISNIMSLIKEKIVYINGTRHVPKNEQTGVVYNLNIDATNLHSFLYTLRNNNEEVFNKIKSEFINIFPDVRSINTNIDTSRNTNITLYFEGMSEPIALHDCGSGFTHVLILLCILFTGKDRIVLFDEPHVFLHPSAEKAIYDLINETNYHQYFLTTHSPILINYPFNKNVFLIRKTNGVSKFDKFDKFQDILKDIGVQNSDFAFSDRVLFVEGKTEEYTVPMILNYFGLKQIGYNYKILDMNGTSNNFSKKTVMNSYKKNLDLILNGVSNSPIPYKILIDKDERDEKKIREIKEQYGDKVLILERREYENYFLDCYKELSDVINEKLVSGRFSPENIQEAIENILAEVKDFTLYPKGHNNGPLSDVIGSRVLNRLFENCGISFGYDKVNDGVKIVTKVLEYSPEKLLPIKNILEDFILSSNLKIQAKELVTRK